MKLLNLNIGIKLDNDKLVTDLINKEQCDIVTLQEVTRKIKGNVYDMYNTSIFIENNTNYINSFFGPLWISDAFRDGENIVRDFGGFIEQGNEILTNNRFLKVKNHFFYKNYAPMVDIKTFRKEDHGRAFVESIIDLKGKLIQIINIHGIWNKDKMGDKRTFAQVESILKEVRNDIPSIVVGDFNLLPNSKSICKLDSRLRNLIKEYDIKSTRPKFQDEFDKGEQVCDYIFVNDKVKVNDFSVLSEIVSGP